MSIYANYSWEKLRCKLMFLTRTWGQQSVISACVKRSASCVTGARAGPLPSLTPSSRPCFGGHTVTVRSLGRKLPRLLQLLLAPLANSWWKHRTRHKETSAISTFIATVFDRILLLLAVKGHVIKTSLPRAELMKEVNHAPCVIEEEALNKMIDI